jgi:hypothetical protein
MAKSLRFSGFSDAAIIELKFAYDLDGKKTTLISVPDDISIPVSK